MRVYELGLDADSPYLVMELLEGGSLGDFEGGDDVLLSSQRILAAARGLGAAHALGIIHRDVKPANLLLPSTGSVDVRVADFGLASLPRRAPLTRAGTVMGTLGYLAPEQARGEPLDARADVYALAASWFRLLTGRTPIAGTEAEMLARAGRHGRAESAWTQSVHPGAHRAVRTAARRP